MGKTKVIDGQRFVLYEGAAQAPEASIHSSMEFYQQANQRRSIREFSSKPIPREVIEYIIKTASTAPSGAHKQPWTFCAISNAVVKTKIRQAAEVEEYENYASRMSAEWLEDLKIFRTDWHKPFLETAPWLIAVFSRVYETDEAGNKRNNYYVKESVGIACGMLLMAIHQAGLVALTHTPNPMNFLTKILNRPANERPFLLIPVGHPAEDTYVPDIRRKPLDKIAVFYD